jgi:hypothetical protein
MMDFQGALEACINFVFEQRLMITVWQGKPLTAVTSPNKEIPSSTMVCPPTTKMSVAAHTILSSWQVWPSRTLPHSD